MDFLKQFDNYTLTIIVGILMLLGSFATINSRSASKFDHDFALLLLIGGVVCLGIGFKVIDLAEIKSLVSGVIAS